MRRLAAGLAAMAALAAAAEARAQGLFDTFQDLCVKTGANDAQAIAAAERQGWTEAPAALVNEFSKLGLTDLDGRVKMENRKLKMVIAGRGAPVISGDKIGLKVCAVGDKGADLASLQKAAAEWAGTPPDPKLPSKIGQAYAFLEDGPGHTQVRADDLNTPAGKKLISAGRVSMLFVGAQGGVPLLVYAKPSM